jgi:hypothetical protein
VTRPIKPRRNPSGRQAKHAGRAIERVTQQNLWDKRTTIYRARCDRANAYVEHFFGGWVNVGALDVLVWAAADVSIILDSISGYVARQGGPITASGELLPVLRKSFIAYQNALRLHLQALAELAKSRPDRTPTLAEYLTQKAAEQAPARNDGASAQSQPEGDAPAEGRATTSTEAPAGGDMGSDFPAGGKIREGGAV